MLTSTPYRLWESNAFVYACFMMQVAAPKHTALCNLSQQAAAVPLSLQLLFSSVAALLGSPGQANYSAANGAMDAAAQHAQQAGTVATSVQWGAWAGAGMATNDASTASRLERLGLGLIPISSGLQALAVAVAGSTSSGPVLAAVPFRWPQFVAAARKPLPELFAPYVTDGTDGSMTKTAAATSSLPAVDAATVEAAVREAVRGILGTDVGAGEPLMAAGLDSLGAVELQSSLERQLGLKLPSTLVFDYPTVAALTEFLTGKLSQVAPAGSSSALGASSFGLRGALIAAVPASGTATVAMLGTSWRSPHGALNHLASATMGIDPVRLVPFDRWDVEADPLAARFGGYLAGIAAFDTAAFATPDAEAALMDPQQRLLLESVGEALLSAPADAALAPMRTRGVYVGRSPSLPLARTNIFICV